MLTLETSCSCLFKQYIDGNHILWKTNFKYWEEISIDQGIKQRLVHHLMSEDGLTKGLTILTFIMCWGYGCHRETTQLFFFTQWPTEERKWNLMIIDKGNCKKLQNLQKKFSSFKKTNSPDSIRNIVTGIHVSSKVNVVTAIKVGSNILSDMLTKGVANYLFKKAYKL